MNQDLYINILMTNEVNNKLKSNPLYIKYLREHSYYYKLLNRDPNLINGFMKGVWIEASYSKLIK